MEKIVIALNLIMDLIDSNDFINEQEITEFLGSTGFTDYEIRQTLSMLDFNNVGSDPIIRYFCNAEKKKFTQDATQYIQKILFSGLLDVFSVEEIIEKSLESDAPKVDAEHIKQLVLYSLLEKKALFSFAQSQEDLTN